LKEEVTECGIAEVVGRWTGVHVSRMLEAEAKKLARMEEELKEHVVGQDDAGRLVSDAVKRSRVGIADPNRPIGSFPFLGPTGVGKTELSKSLAKFMFDDENAVIRVDMSEFMEKHSVSKLIGSPPGYVGHEEGSTFTEKVRHRPYSVILFDEIEKAHPEVFNVLLQVLDSGHLTDSRRSMGFTEQSHETDGMEEIKRLFAPEFRNRLDGIIQFKPLDERTISNVVDKFIIELEHQLEQKRVTLHVDESARKWLAVKGYDPKMGARPMSRVIQEHMKRVLADELLFGRLAKGGQVTVSLNKDEDDLQIEVLEKEAVAG